jgi:uncharacterized membrane protein YagU involved in acid resistance
MSKLFISALLAAVAAGIPDVFVAAALSRTTPGRILQTIASGVLGKASYDGGATSMLMGLCLQVAMSFVIALIFNIGFMQIASVHRNPLTFGALYGLAIFVVMNFVVVPLSRAHPQPHWDVKSVVAMTIVMVLFAEVIALIARALGERA